MIIAHRSHRKGAISVAFVHPSVCLSVAYIEYNSRTQRPSVPKSGRQVPHLRYDSHTSFKVKRSKVKITRPINAHTHRAPYLPTGKAYVLQTWCTDGGRRPAPATGAMTSKVKGQGRKVMWSVWAVLAHKSKTNSRSSPKLAKMYLMTRATLRTTFKVKRSKIRVTGRTQTHKMCHSFRTVRPKNLMCGWRT